MPLKDLSLVNTSNITFLIIDPQPRIMDGTASSEQIIKNIELLVNSAKILKVPILVTEQYPKGLGSIAENIAEILPEDISPIPKVEFDCFGNADFCAMIDSCAPIASRKYLAIMGVETHICVFQTVLGALNNGYIPIILSDAVSSRKSSDDQIALDFYKSAGLTVISSEMLIYLLLKKAGTAEFKELLPILK